MGDYIKREDAINLLYFFADESCSSVVSDFEAIPAADVAPVRHGRWILVDKNGTGVCSECNRQDRIDLLAKYCRYCGALMDGKEDGHEVSG